jgi:hypothetical protein
VGDAERAAVRVIDKIDSLSSPHAALETSSDFRHVSFEAPVDGYRARRSPAASPNDRMKTTPCVYITSDESC